MVAREHADQEQAEADAAADIAVRERAEADAAALVAVTKGAPGQQLALDDETLQRIFNTLDTVSPTFSFATSFARNLRAVLAAHTGTDYLTRGVR